MRLALYAIALLLLFATVAVAEEERPVCEACGMFVDVSPTRVEAVIQVSEMKHEHMFDCLGCLHDYVHEHFGEEAKVARLSILDYATFGTDKEVMLNGFEAYYLYGTERLKGSMPPYVAAFADEAAAKEHQEDLGGKLVDFEGMQALMSEAKAEAESENGHGQHEHGAMAGDAMAYVCPCTGGCCSDIVSGKPGECPRCGMSLVAKEAEH